MKRHLIKTFLFGFFVLASPAHGETLFLGSIVGNTAWTAANSPYVVLGATYIESGAVLTIEPGVVVKGSDITVRGELRVEGTEQEPVFFTSIKDDSVGGDTNEDGDATLPAAGDWPQIRIDPEGYANIAYAVIRYGGDWRFGWPRANIFNKGTLDLSYSSVSDSLSFGVLNDGGIANITFSEFTRNYYGIYSFGTTKLTQNSFSGNYGYAVYNGLYYYSGEVMDAPNNWWGASDGPKHWQLNPDGLGDSISIGINFEPWLAGDPLDAQPIPECCSSVLFLPGLEASRLYGEDGKRLWEPEIDHDNTRLFLNPDGSSIEPNIYTKDIIDEALFPVVGANIYKSFEDSMLQLESDGVINGYQSYPYDWRFDINDIVNNPTRINSGLASMIPTLEALAQNSQTGKVTIIAHSNGGLVGKVLISELERQGKTNLVDKFIMIAVPQLGTPKAAAALLHGENLPSDSAPFMMKASTARSLAENMASGYTLLPSSEYFNRVLDPVIEFDFNSPLAQIYRDKYGVAVTNSAELHDFLLGAEGREKPLSSDVISPNIVNGALLAEGAENHTLLDNWSAPENIEVIQIAGWGIDTIRGIKYTERRKYNCAFLDCFFLDPEPLWTSDGDSTVVVPSAVAQDVETFYLNIKEYNDETIVDRSHARILEIQPLREFIEGIIKNNFSLKDYITIDKPAFNLEEDEPALRLKIHSPVSVDIYDEFGNHTGVLSSFGEDKLIEENIPNSYYIEMGEGKYAGADISGTTTVKLIGQDFGTFTLEIEKVAGNNILATSTFVDIPVALGSIATLQSSEIGDSKLKLDIDADGFVDSFIAPGEGLTTEELIGVLSGFIKTLHLPEDREVQLLNKVNKLAKTLSADYYKKQRTDAAFANLIRSIDSFQKKGLLTLEEAIELKALIGRISGEVVE